MKNYSTNLCFSQVLKLAVIMLISLNFNTVFAQDSILEKEISITFNNQNLESALSKIEKVTGYSFSYEPDAVKKNININKSYTNATLREVLNKTLVKYQIYYKVLGTSILIQRSAEKGQVSGKITTNDGKPASFVSLLLEDTKFGISADENGYYSFSAPEGEYTLLTSSIGFEKRKKNISIVANKNTQVHFVLNETSKALQEVIVNGNRKRVYADKQADYVARMPLKNIENPQVYNVVTNELLNEQIVVDVNDAFRNTVGAVPVTFSSGGIGITFRGFGTGINARNGMETVSGRSSVDLANVERIEVLKGPSGTLFGSSASSYGGVVNLVTKKPQETKKTEVSYTTGSFGLNRLTADINTPLTEDNKVLFRLNAAVTKQKSFLNYGFNDSYLIAPSLVYKATDKLTFTVDAELYKANNTRPEFRRYDANSGITNPNDVQFDYETALFNEDLDAETTASKAFVQAEYQLSENWKSTTLFSFVGEDVDRSYQYYTTWKSPTEVSRRVGLYGPIYNNYTNIQENINGKFNTGNLKHNILIGANYRTTTAQFSYGFTGFFDTIDVTTDFDVIRKSDVDPVLSENTYLVSNQQTFSAYVSDVIDFTEKFSAMFSLRLDNYNREIIGDREGYKQTSLSPKLGLIYQVVENQLSVFGNYMNGFNNNSPVTQPDGSQLVLDPEYANQYEGGIKVEAFDKKLSTTLSYYNIAIDNATRYDANNFATQDGKQVSKGIDFEFIANPVAGLNVVFGYAYNDNRIVRAQDASIEGNKASGSPENVINYWVSYKFQKKLHGLGVGVGGNFVDQLYRSSDNVFYVPEYTLLNSTIFYEQSTWRFGIKFNNITNQKYWDSSAVAAQNPRNFTANLTLKF
ncbi:ferrichrome-iron receptor [Polaribacter irgensii 23-P]|uniref:Ferrichrome-iron receptor n=1 Tax=Polaribacter irgensii 23-P TaxID=313594 RepID=A4C0J6_9FLAO|nr:TonB-dependent receptor [Polaribacter irgensii]EAR12939.1 ferrichrome-iron receptor [Polaribacter irgensii 23-P]